MASKKEIPISLIMYQKRINYRPAKKSYFIQDYNVTNSTFLLSVEVIGIDISSGEMSFRDLTSHDSVDIDKSSSMFQELTTAFQDYQQKQEQATQESSLLKTAHTRFPTPVLITIKATKQGGFDATSIEIINHKQQQSNDDQVYQFFLQHYQNAKTFYDSIIIDQTGATRSAAYDVVPMTIAGWKRTTMVGKPVGFNNTSKRKAFFRTYYDKNIHFRLVQIVVKIVHKPPQRCESCKPSLRCMFGHVEDIFKDKEQDDEDNFSNTKKNLGHPVHFYFTAPPLSPDTPSHELYTPIGFGGRGGRGTSQLLQPGDIFELFIVPENSHAEGAKYHHEFAAGYTRRVNPVGLQPQSRQYLDYVNMITQQHQQNVKNYIDYLKQEDEWKKTADPLLWDRTAQFKARCAQYNAEKQTSLSQQPLATSQQQQKEQTRSTNTTAPSNIHIATTKLSSHKEERLVEQCSICFTTQEIEQQQQQQQYRNHTGFLSSTCCEKMMVCNGCIAFTHNTACAHCGAPDVRFNANNKSIDTTITKPKAKAWTTTPAVTKTQPQPKKATTTTVAAATPATQTQPKATAPKQVVQDVEPLDMASLTAFIESAFDFDDDDE